VRPLQITSWHDGLSGFLGKTKSDREIIWCLLRP
jgi:hypothetical protein